MGNSNSSSNRGTTSDYCLRAHKAVSRCQVLDKRLEILSTSFVDYLPGVFVDALTVVSLSQILQNSIVDCNSFPRCSETR